MNKLSLFFISSVFTINIFAAVNSDEPANFENAVNLYKSKDYESSYHIFKKLFFEDMSNTKINFYLGRAAFEIKEYNGAVAAFERVLITDPDNMRSRLELARTYFALSMFEQAEIEFTKVLLQPLPQEVRENVNQFIVYINESKKRSFLTGSVSVGLLSDDNVNNGNDYTVPLLSNEPINAKKSDTAHSESAAINHIYDIGIKRGFLWQSGANVFAKNYLAEEDFNILYSSVNTGLAYNSAGFSFSLPVGFDYLYYGKEEYLSSYNAALKFAFPYDTDKKFLIEIKHQDKSNLQTENKLRDSTINELTAGVQNMMYDSTAMFSMLFVASTERKKEGERVDIDNDTASLKFQFYKKFFNKLMFNAGYSFKYLAYVDEIYNMDSEKDELRADLTHTASLGIAYDFSAGYSLNLNGTMTKNESSNEFYTYDKNSYALTFAKSF